MRRITLIVLLTLSMLLTMGDKVVGDSITQDSSVIIDAVPRQVELIPFSTENSLDNYVDVAPNSVQIYFYTKKYCKQYRVPEEIAFAIVGLETGYKGPDKFNYNPSLISSANAYGAYQLLLSTAKDMYVLLGIGPRSELTADMLLHDTHLNVRLGIRYLRWLNDNINTNWTIACGFYNSGYEIVNEYARHAVKVYNAKRIAG